MSVNIQREIEKNLQEESPQKPTDVEKQNTKRATLISDRPCRVCAMRVLAGCRASTGGRGSEALRRGRGLGRLEGLRRFWQRLQSQPLSSRGWWAEDTAFLRHEAHAEEGARQRSHVQTPLRTPLTRDFFNFIFYIHIFIFNF